MMTNKRRMNRMRKTAHRVYKDGHVMASLYGRDRAIQKAIELADSCVEKGIKFGELTVINMETMDEACALCLDPSSKRDGFRIFREYGLPVENKKLPKPIDLDQTMKDMLCT